MSGQPDDGIVQAVEARLAALEERIAALIEERDRVQATRLDVARERLEAMIVAKVDGAQPAFSSDDQDAAEARLLRYLAPFLRDRHAIDVGAHRGRYTRELLDLGFEVAAVEPHPELAGALAEELAGRPATVLPVAVDAASGRTALRFASVGAEAGEQDATLFSTILDREGAGPLAFGDGVEVETTTIDALRRDLGWPAEVGFVKLDVEGAEARVLQGLGDTRPEVLMAEFWGAEHVLAVPGADPLVAAPDGMSRSIALAHGGGGAVEFLVQPVAVPPTSWGNVLFFRDHDAFVAGVRWCQAHLPERMHLVS